MWPIITSGVVMGLFSSLHCVGMCGPLVMALPLAGLTDRRRFLSLLAYHGGRLLTYALLGLAFGLAGRRLQLAGWQQGFSIVLGMVILVACICSFAHRQLATFLPVAAYQRAITGLNLRLWQAPRRYGFLLLGMANGLLPCGMVYLAIAGALTAGHAGFSSLFMACFGLGTLPALLAVGYGGWRVSLAWRVRFRKAVPVVMLTMGVLLILRGLDLTIPFISPLLPTAPSGGVSCH